MDNLADGRAEDLTLVRPFQRLILKMMVCIGIVKNPDAQILNFRIIIVEFRSMGFWMRSQVIIIAPMYMFLLTKIGNWVIVSHELKYRR